MTFNEVTQYIGNFFIYGSVSVGIFWLVAQKSAERWVDAYFAKRQKEFEHEQAKELQRIKAKLDTVIQGSLKLQEREFKIIPEAWEKIEDAYGLACWLCAPMQEYASLEYMSDSHLEEFLSKQELLWETQKEQIRNTPTDNRNNVWQKIDMQMRSSKVRSSLADSDKFLKANSIFLPDDLREQLSKMVQVIWNALISFNVGNAATPKDSKLIHEAWAKLKTEGEPLHMEIEKAVRKRLLEQTQLADEQLQSMQ